MKKRYLISALVILSFISIFIGVKDISFLDLILFREDHWGTIFISRLPRLISVIITGASMSICGIIMQQIARNKFISPSTGPTIALARLGILVSIIIFSSATSIQKMLISFLFSLVGTIIFIKLLNSIKFKDAVFIPLIGIMLGNIIDSITNFFAYKYDLIQNISSWLQGDFSMVLKGRYELLYIGIPALVIAFLYANKFTIAGMGEDFAINLGINYNIIVNIGLMIVSLITSVVVITVGVVPFLGLIIPNIVSLYKGDNLKNNLVDTTLIGALFILICDILSRIIIYPFEIPISVIVGIIGSIIFLYLLLRRKNYAL